MNITTHHYTHQRSRTVTDYQTNLACEDCRTLIATVHHVVRRRRPSSISATLYVDGVQSIDIGDFRTPGAARLSIAKLHRLLCG